MREEFFQFIQSPAKSSYMAVRAKLVASDGYEPYSDEINSAAGLFEQQRLDEACKVLQSAMMNLILSPRAHNLLGFLYHKLGNEEAAQMEMMVGQACMEGILSSGDGSAGDPYIVSRTSDEYDVIEYLEPVSKLLLT